MLQAASNSSPLIHLAKIGRFNLLRRFSSVCIPPAVWHEVVEEGVNRPGVTEIRKGREAGWISVIEPANRPDDVYRYFLDGETTALQMLECPLLNGRGTRMTHGMDYI